MENPPKSFAIQAGLIYNKVVRVLQGGIPMSMSFTVAIQKEDDWFVAICLENSVASQGKTMDEATENLREALELYYE